MPNATGYGQTTTLPSEEELAAMEAELATAESVPPPSGALVPAGTPPPPTQTVSYPTATGAGYQTPAPETQDASYGQQIAPAPAYSEPVPAPAPAPDYNYGAAEPYGQSQYAVDNTGNALASQSAYSPPPRSEYISDSPPPPPRPYTPSYSSSSDVSPSGRSFADSANVSEAFIPTPSGANDPYAMDRPGSAVNDRNAMRRYENSQRVAEFQRQNPPPPPPSLQSQDVGRGAITMPAGNITTPMDVGAWGANTATAGERYPRDSNRYDVPPPAAPTPGANADRAALYNMGYRGDPGFSAPQHQQSQRRPGGRWLWKQCGRS